MNKMRYIFLTICFICTLFCASQTYIEPVFDRTDIPELHINKIEVTKDTTFVYCSLTLSAGYWATISADTYLFDPVTNRKYKILRSPDLPYSPEQKTFMFGGRVPVLFCFPSISNVHELDFIENPNKRAFNIYGINLKEHYSKSYQEEDFEHFFNISSIYESENDTLKALENKQEAIEVARYINGVKSPRCLETFFQKCDMYIRYGMYQDAIEETKKMLEVVQDDSLAHIFYIPAYKFYIGLANIQLKREKDALYWFKESYLDFQDTPDKNQYYIYGCVLNNLSNTLNITGNYSSAYKIAQEACIVSKEQIEEDLELQVAALLALSDAEFGVNKSADAIAHLEKAVQLADSANWDEVKKKRLWEKLQFVRLRLNMFEEAVDEEKSQLITDNTILLEIMNNSVQGNNQDAIVRLKSLIADYENNFESAPLANYIGAVSSLSNALVYEGAYADADRILDKSLNLLHQKDIQSDQIKHLYQSKGYLFFMLNNTEKAIYWYKLAMDIYEKNHDNKSVTYALLISNVAQCYFQIEDFSLAKKLTEQASSIFKEFYGENNTDAYESLLIMNNLASLYVKMEDYNKGKELYELIIKYADSKQNEPVKAMALVNLAEIYMKENDFVEAEKCLSCIDELNAPSYVKGMANCDMFTLKCLTNNKSVISDMAQYNVKVKDGLADVFSRFSESEREEYWSQKGLLLIALNNLVAHAFNNSETNIMAFDNAVFTKNLLIKSNRLLGNVVKNSDEGTKRAYETMLYEKRKMSVKGIPKDSIDFYMKDISEIEKQIVSSISNFGEILKSQFFSCTDVKKMLSDKDVAVEFVLLPQIKNQLEEITRLLGALVLTKDDDAPTLIPLCSEDDLGNLLEVENTTDQGFIDSLYSITNRRLYQMVWESIEPYIQEGASIYYSPTGYISKINITAISDGNRRLGDKFNFYEVSSTAMIDQVKQQMGGQYVNATLYGDINYYEDTDKMAEMSTRYTSSSSGVLATRSLNRSSWNLLPGTKEEISAIGSLMKAKGMYVQMYSQNDANEESFKALDGHAPEIIHVATHGFYFPEEENITSKFFNSLNGHTNTNEDYSLLYSGLLFAGANNAWTGETLTEGVEDGILTADEISRLDLSGNKLTVLSACETGLGEIDYVNGVLGLQRGLKRAGVGTILMSLWKVPDEETKVLMSVFYKDLLSGKTPHQALKIAQKHLTDLGKSPYYWAGFVLLD